MGQPAMLDAEEFEFIKVTVALAAMRMSDAQLMEVADCLQAEFRRHRASRHEERSFRELDLRG